MKDHPEWLRHALFFVCNGTPLGGPELQERALAACRLMDLDPAEHLTPRPATTGQHVNYTCAPQNQFLRALRDHDGNSPLNDLYEALFRLARHDKENRRNGLSRPV